MHQIDRPSQQPTHGSGYIWDKGGVKGQVFKESVKEALLSAHDLDLECDRDKWLGLISRPKLLLNP